MIKLTLSSLLIAAAIINALFWTRWSWKHCGCNSTSAPPVSIYATKTADGDSATCYADGKTWPARADGQTINCFAADMPKEMK